MPKPKSTTSLTISLPREMAQRVQAAMKTEQRTRSELVREALRSYFARSEEVPFLARLAALPRVRPTASELRELRKGRQEMKRGNYWTLDDFTHWIMADVAPQARAKESATRTKKRARKTTLRA